MVLNHESIGPIIDLFVSFGKKSGRRLLEPRQMGLKFLSLRPTSLVAENLYRLSFSCRLQDDIGARVEATP